MGYSCELNKFEARLDTFGPGTPKIDKDDHRAGYRYGDSVGDLSIKTEGLTVSAGDVIKEPSSEHDREDRKELPGSVALVTSSS